MSYSVSLNRAEEGTGCKGECRLSACPFLGAQVTGRICANCYLGGSFWRTQ